MNNDINGHLVHSITISGQPDCLKLFPYEFRNDNLEGTLIAATYQYHPEIRLRTGGIIAFKPSLAMNDMINNVAEDYQNEQSHLFTSLALPGVLSCSWIKRPEYFAVTCVTSDLTIITVKVEAEPDSGGNTPLYHLEELNEIILDKEGGSIGLSLVHYDDKGSLSSVTSSSGYVYIIEDGVVTQNWRAHEMETWTSVFQPGNSNVLCTGSDDGTVKMFDLRKGTAPVHTILGHEYGVTSLQFKKDDPSVLFTGGFDKQLMLFDMRNVKTPLLASHLDCAVWHIDFMADETLNIAGCYDGAFIYKKAKSGNEYNLVKKFVPPDPLIYGVSHVQVSDRLMQICCDFYNRKILLWG